MPVELLTLGHETFTPLVGTDFELVVEGRAPVTLTLDQVRVLPAAPNAPRTAFGLSLSTPEASVFPQRIYLLRHPALGELEVFIVPSGPRDGRMRYEITFG